MFVLRIVALVLTCAAFSGTAASDVAAAEADTLAARADSSVASPRSPRGAMLRSIALPGWGQFYNRRYIKGVLIAAAETASVVAFFVREQELRDEAVPAGQAPKRNPYLYATLGVIFYSAVDAFVDAHLDGVDWGAVETDGRVGIERRFRAGDLGIRLGGWYEIVPPNVRDARGVVR